MPSWHETGCAKVTQTPTTEASERPADRIRRLRELAALFLRLGLTAFGGPAAHVAILEDEVVTRRGWLSRDEFVDLLGATPQSANKSPSPSGRGPG